LVVWCLRLIGAAPFPLLSEPMQQVIPVNPDLLRWARVEAGYSLPDAASRAKIAAPRKGKNRPEQTAVDRLAGWENGSNAPSLSQLERLAKAYRRPLITFFLPKPPEKMAAMPDFRTLGGSTAGADSPEFSALRRRIAVLQQELRDLSKDAGSEKLSFIGSISDDTPVSDFVGDIRRTLGVKVEDQMHTRDGGDLFRLLRSAAQRAGIYVLVVGDLGTHHSSIAVDEFRGMALADELAPMVVINPNDRTPARLFTLMHELAHLWLGSTGISSFDALCAKWEPTDFCGGAGHGSRERLCNSVAGEFLVPEADLLTLWEATKESPELAAKTLATRFKVSEAVLGRRLLDLGLISGDAYAKLLAKCMARWKKLKDDKPKDGGAPRPETMDKFRLGEKTIQTLISAAQAGHIGFHHAARLMNIPVSRFDKVAQ